MGSANKRISQLFTSKGQIKKVFGSDFKKPSGPPGKNADKALADAALEILGASRGTRQGYFSQLEQVLGGQIPEARIPDIQTATEGALRQGSDERRQTEDTLATAGLAQTPLGVGERAQTELRGEQRSSTTAADFLNSLFLQAPNAVLGQAQATGMEGLGTISNIGAAIAAQRAQSRGALIGGLGAGAGQLAGYGIQSKFGVPATTSIYG